MPAKSSSQSLSRLVELLSAIPSGQLTSPAELQVELARRGLTVDTRTVQRDLRLLQRHFALECDERSKPHGWRWRSASARDSVLGMSTPEALGLVLLEKHLQLALPATWSASLNELFTQARGTLDKLGPLSGAKHWPGKVHVVAPGLSTLAPRLPPVSVLAELSEALLSDRQLRLDYRKAGSSGTAPYLVHPLGLLLRGQAVYLVALSDADRSGAARHFALHRIESASMLPKASAVPPGVDMASAMAQSAGQFGAGQEEEAIDLCLHCDAVLAGLLEESPLSADQCSTPLADGRYEITAHLRPSWELRWWLLAHIAELEVVAPSSLRDEMRRTLETAAARHQARTST